MFGLFKKKVAARKCRAASAFGGPVAAIECLEARVVPAINLVYSGTTLSIYGSGADDDLQVTVTGSNSVTLTTSSAFTGAGSGTTAGPFNIGGTLTISMGDGADNVDIEAGAGGGTVSISLVTIDMGSGDDLLTVARNMSDDLEIQNDVEVYGGSGDDYVLMGAWGSSLDVYKLTIDNQTDTGAGNQGVYLDECNVGNNLTITQSGTGLQDVQLGYGGANTVGGNLIVTQSNAANASGYSTDIIDTSVTGFVTITNGNGTGGAISRIRSTSASSIGGTVTMTNGNNTDNQIVLGDGGGTLTLGQSIAVTNKNATSMNRIEVSGVTTTFASASVKFTNGETSGSTGTNNLIVLGWNGSNTFAVSQIVDLENKAVGGGNQVNVYSTTLGGLKITNGASGGTNEIRTGYFGDVYFSGNVVIANGTATNSNLVEVSDLIAGVGTTGNVTVSNNTTAVTDVKFGDAGSNSILGNLTVTNQATTGLRTTTISGTAVDGTAGLYIYNVGTGDSKVEVVGGSTITKLLKIEDGSGDAIVNIGGATMNNFTYTDVNGGVDTINLGSSGTMTVIATTTVTTGGGSDTVSIGVTGTADFGGLVNIQLGAASDSLYVGHNAVCTAFSTNNLQFDGGAGSDSASISTTSMGSFSIPLPGSLTGKITSFSSLSYY